MIVIEEIYLDNFEKREQLRIFLSKFHLEYESDIDYSLAVYDDECLVATASKAKNILKCFAILESYQGQGISNQLVKKIEDRMFQEGLYHFFIFTPDYNKKIFLNIGYTEVITSQNIAILENGNRNINQFLLGLKINNGINDDKKACIIMNCNPFTFGHLYLIEKAAKENEQLIIFVVTEDKSSFPFAVRLKLIKEGTKHLHNVKVIETGPYLISSLTFPTYFLKEKNNVVKIQARMDCEIFGTYYKKVFNINRRYIGTEPYCDVTKQYNEMMKAILPEYGIEVVEVVRKDIDNNIISASKVRKLIKENRIEDIKPLVPKSTYDYLISAEAVEIIEKIKTNQGRH